MAVLTLGVQELEYQLLPLEHRRKILKILESGGIFGTAAAWWWVERYVDGKGGGVAAFGGD